jgi:hypothetical protein
MDAHTNTLLKEISQLTETIKVKYPSLYLNLSEEKPAFDADDEDGLTEHALQTYLDFLKSRLKHFLEVKNETQI